MKHRATILYAMAWFAYVAFSLTMFPRWGINVAIPSIGLVGLGGWLYGKSIGLVLIIPAVAYHQLLFSVYGDIVNYYENRIVGPLIFIAVVWQIGTLRDKLDAIKALNARLDQMVAERNREWTLRSMELLERIEALRVMRGQELHDGIGQQLTGIQLFCSALAEGLEAEHSTHAALAYSLRNRAHIVHNLVRRVARTLFPVRMKETGLILALDELAACFKDIYNIRTSVAAHGNVQHVSLPVALQLYRICQETGIAIIHFCGANRIDISATAEANSCRIMLTHNGEPLDEHIHGSITARLIAYRLTQIRGRKDALRSPGEGETLAYSAPIPMQGRAP